MKPASYSLRGRLTLAMLLIFALGLGASALFTHVEVFGTIKEVRKRSLQGQASELLDAGLHVAADGSVTLMPSPEWAEVYRLPKTEFAYTLFDAAGRAVAISPNLNTPLPQTAVGMVQTLGPDRKVALTVPAPGGHTLVVARASADTEALAESLLEENAEHFLVLLPFALATLPLIWKISGWSLRPLSRVSDEAAAIGPATSPARLSTHELPREIRPLVEAMNGALERLARAIEAERRLTADAAHQLRTPLTVLDLRLQRARMTGGEIDWAAATREMTQLRRMVSQLLDLARMDHAARNVSPTDGDAEQVNLSRLAREAAAAALPIADAMGRELNVDAPQEGMFVQGRADHLREVICALIDNALIHGAGLVQVSVRPVQGSRSSTKGAGLVSVVVSDEGQGVPGELREAVFDRFRKGDASSPGAGLGLAIVREIVRAHKGTVSFDPGDCSCVRVTIPMAAATRRGLDPDASMQRLHRAM